MADVERRKEPVGNAVRTALVRYFEQLGGQPTVDLYRRVMEEVEKPLLQTTLAYNDGNQTRTAEMLGLNRGTLRKKLRQYGLD